MKTSIGCLVSLITGGPIMTINGYREFLDHYECVWFSDDQLNIIQVPKTLLKWYNQPRHVVSRDSGGKLCSGVNSDDQEKPLEFSEKDPFGNPIINSWDDDVGTWYEDGDGNTYTEEMGDPCNWPDHD